MFGIRKFVVKTALSIGGKQILTMFDKSLSKGEQGDVMKKTWNKFKSFMNGKKRWTAFVMAAWPTTIAALVTAGNQVGLDPDAVNTIASWGGPVVIGAIGIVHAWIKRFDDLTPDNDGE